MAYKPGSRQFAVPGPVVLRIRRGVDTDIAPTCLNEAFKIILSDDAVKAVFINIFGGIVRCDMIAEGVIGAVKEVGVKVPVVVRLQGNNAEIGAKVLTESGLNIIADTDLTGAAQKVVAAAANA